MLYITYLENGVQRVRSAHVGSNSCASLMSESIEILSAQADGHELEHIWQHTTGLPDAKGNRVVKWFGDHAKFIVANLF